MERYALSVPFPCFSSSFPRPVLAYHGDKPVNCRLMKFLPLLAATLLVTKIGDDGKGGQPGPASVHQNPWKSFGPVMP